MACSFDKISLKFNIPSVDYTIYIKFNGGAFRVSANPETKINFFPWLKIQKISGFMSVAELCNLAFDVLIKD